MSVINAKLPFALAVSAAVLSFAAPLGAQEPQLPADPAQTAAPIIPLALEGEALLLERLATADPAEAIRVDRELQMLWNKSGSSSMDLLLKRGRDALEVGDIEAAIEHLTALTDHAPDFAEGWHLRATAYFHAELFGPAVADLERVLYLNPNNYMAMYGLGTILEAFGEQDLAFQAYERAQAIHPHFDKVSDALDRLQNRVQGQTL